MDIRLMKNNMLQKTRYILTGWYVLITMLVSVIFSLVIYFGISAQLKDIPRFIEYSKQNPQFFAQIPKPPFPDPTDVNPKVIEKRIRTTLIVVNVVLVFISAGVGYLLAGKSLKPVKEMVDEQSRFVSDASHELRAPITAIRTELEVASMNDHISEDAQKILKSNLEEIIHLQDLANDLLELNCYEEQEYSAHFTKNSLLDVSEQAISNVIPLAKEKHITIDNQFQDINVLGDKSSLVRLLTILLENAVKYSGNDKTISLNSEIHKGQVLLRLTDQGIGISDKDKRHIFDRFFRADQSRSRHSVSGYGLGLAIAKLIIQKHSGQILVESTPGKGSTFIISLPHFA